jgi:hypothetical protein
MDCPHCGKAFHEGWEQTDLAQSEAVTRTLARDNSTWFGWKAKITSCPACKNATIELLKYHYTSSKAPELTEEFRAYPPNTFRNPTPKEVPPDIKADYEEACKVLAISSKASAALSRRCLQGILREQGYNQKDLVKQIEAFLAEADPAKSLPSSLHDAVDAIRNFGNFSAHPMSDQTSLQVIPVAPGEAEWCLDILEDLFDHYYVKPAQVAARKAALNAKLASAGKPPSR